MNIIIAAEKPSIATLLSDYVKRPVNPDDIEVSENPNETGSFFVGFNLERYVMSPSGEIHSTRIRRLRRSQRR
jgi:hypothetical protein